jgi:hypothetical protein
MRLEAGDKVIMTQEAVNQGLAGRKRRMTGLVVRTREEDYTVMVLRDGLKQAERWAEAFWRKKS